MKSAYIISLPRWSIVLLLGYLLVLVGEAELFADYQLPRQPPASAVSKRVRLEVGQRTEILLEARGNGGRDVAFILREGPKRGKLGPIRKVRPGEALVTYTHSSRKGEGVDSIRYAVQLSGGPVSAAGVVTIEAVDSGPRLEFPLMVDFGRVMPGEQPEQEIELYNAGGGILSGVVLCEAPFSVVDDANSFNLGPRQKMRMQLRFSPKTTGDFQGAAIISTQGGGQIDLHGSCFVPLVAVPEKVRMNSDADGMRASRITLKSDLEEEMVCKMTYEGGIDGPTEVRIAPLDVAEFDVWATKGDPGGRLSEIRIQQAAFQLTIPVEVDPVAPLLRLGADQLDLGTITNAEAEAEIWIENSGGEPGQARIEVANAKLDPESGSVTVSPGTKHRVKVRWSDPEGVSSRRVSVVAAKPQSLELKAKFATKKAEPSKLPAGSAISQYQSDFQVAAEDLSDIPPVTGIKVVKRTQREIFLQWRAPERALSYVTELLVFEKKGSSRVPMWKKVEPDSVRTQAGVTTMELRGLSPGAAYAIRVRSVDGLKKVSLPSAEVRVATLVPEPLRIPWTALAFVSMFGAMLWLAYLRWFRGY